jgi:hypothetical protein
MLDSIIAGNSWVRRSTQGRARPWSTGVPGVPVTTAWQLVSLGHHGSPRRHMALRPQAVSPVPGQMWQRCAHYRRTEDQYACCDYDHQYSSKSTRFPIDQLRTTDGRRANIFFVPAYAMGACGANPLGCPEGSACRARLGALTLAMSAGQSSAQGLHSRRPHCHICTGTELNRSHICTGTGPSAATSAPGLGPLLRRAGTRLLEEAVAYVRTTYG